MGNSLAVLENCWPHYSNIESEESTEKQKDGSEKLTAASSFSEEQWEDFSSSSSSSSAEEEVTQPTAPALAPAPTQNNTLPSTNGMAHDSVTERKEEEAEKGQEDFFADMKVNYRPPKLVKAAPQKTHETSSSSTRESVAARLKFNAEELGVAEGGAWSDGLEDLQMEDDEIKEQLKVKNQNEKEERRVKQAERERKRRETKKEGKLGAVKVQAVFDDEGDEDEEEEGGGGV